MIIDIAAQKALWQEAFGDTDAFLDSFFATGFSPSHCQCLYQNHRLAAALYWFDCLWQDKKLAYLYAVATKKSLQGQGLCRSLMEATHTQLQRAGYAGAVLVPGNDGLAGMYEKFGYKTFSFCKKEEIFPSKPLSIKEISPSEYASLRQVYLPENAVCQETPAFLFLATFCRFYRTKDGLFCISRQEDTLNFQEFLGDISLLPGITAAMNAEKAVVRVSDDRTPFAMYRSFTGDDATPGYFALPMD